MLAQSMLDVSVVAGIVAICALLAKVLGGNTTSLWAQVGRLEERLETQAKKIELLETHVARLDDENENLKREVDTHRVARGMATKYFTS